jgi:transcriptional regulator CtsR
VIVKVVSESFDVVNRLLSSVGGQVRREEDWKVERKEGGGKKIRVRKKERKKKKRLFLPKVTNP